MLCPVYFASYVLNLRNPLFLYAQKGDFIPSTNNDNKSNDNHIIKSTKVHDVAIIIFVVVISKIKC